MAVFIGINDVWRQFDSDDDIKNHISLELYKQTLNELVSKTLPKVKGIILMTPFFIEPLTQDPMRNMMDKYGAAVKEIAKEYKLICVDQQKVIIEALGEHHSSHFCWDRVHPNATGHFAIARAFLKAIEYKF